MLPAVSEAEVVTVEADGQYMLGDDDNISTAKERARQDALRSAAEKAGVFVKSYTETHNMVLTKDDVIVVSSNLLNVQHESITNEVVGGLGFKVNCHVVATFDTDNINMTQMLNTQTMAIKERDDAIERLNRENAQLKAQMSAQNAVKIKENETLFKINLYERELIKEANKNNIHEAGKWADKLRVLDPDNDIYRCFTYTLMGKQECVTECDKYLVAHPDDFVAEICRINALYNIKNNFPTNDIDRKAVDRLVKRAKKILPLDVYYSSVSPTVLKGGSGEMGCVEGPNGIVINEQISFLFENVYGVCVRDLADAERDKKKSEVIIAYAKHPDDVDGKECDKVLNRYEKIYSYL
jgi:hypothetical protein